jgi:3-dehydroquinate synthase
LPTVRVRLKAREAAYAINVKSGLIDEVGVVAKRALPSGARKVALISNSTVFELYGERVLLSLRSAEFDVLPMLVGDGERHKSMRTLDRVLSFLTESKFERSDAVVALGGGVVGDLAGFASAVYLRGIGLLQVPTTLLSQIDSSVGGKTGVNMPQGKNLVGAFHQPRAVCIDTATLKTLPERELTAGWCEAVKQGAAGDRALFDETLAFLSKPEDSGSKSDGKLASLIAKQCAFKASIVAGDEHEALHRADARSRKILNFGHTTAHALESATKYRRFRHGEAVGYGMLVAGELSKRLGLLDTSELELLRTAVHACGRLPRADDLDPKRILELIAHDKKSIGGRIKWVLLSRIGRAAIIDGGEISNGLLTASLHAAFQRHS